VSYFREKWPRLSSDAGQLVAKEPLLAHLDCVDCHMQKTPKGDIGHIAWTDHRILRRPLKQVIEPAPAQNLIPFNLENAKRSAELGLAYAELALRTREFPPQF